jgi:hypothetical protein
VRKSLYGAALLFVIVFGLLSPGAGTVYGDQVEQILNADYEALEEPLLPETGGYEPVAINAKLGYVWSLPDQTQAMVFLGDFSLQMPHQTLSSRDAVVWLTVMECNGRKIKKLDVFMEGEARIEDAAGGETADEVLYLTISTSGSVEMAGESISRCDGSNQEIYQRAQKLRSTGPTSLPTTREVIVHAKPAAKELEPQPRQPIAIRGDFVVGPELAGQPVLIGTNGIYIMQSAAPGGEALELRAKNAVVFLKSGAMKSMGRLDGKPKKSAPATMPTSMTAEQIQKKVSQLPTEEEAAREVAPMKRAQQSSDVAAIYMEGDVVLIRGYRQIRADKIYYDFEENKALILNAVARSIVPKRDVPIYVRADEIRQLNEREFEATDAKLTANEFYTPSYHVGATKIYFEDRTERLADGEQVGLVAGTYKVYNATLNVEGVPILYWPYITGDFKQAETSIKSVNFGYSSDYGVTAKTRWYLLPLLGLEEPEGVTATLKLDYYGDRGPAVGVDSYYERDTYYGLLRSYYIHDSGEDQLGGIRGDVEPPSKNRGRFLTRHRQYLPQDWELTFELSYLSDQNFLEEYFRNEFEEDKEQETDIYLKKVFGDAVFSILGKWRINDFLTQTEKLPDVAFDVLGKQLGDSMVTWFSENHVGAVRRLNADDTPWWCVWGSNREQTDVVARADTRHEFDAPLTVGQVKLVPFTMVRGTAWDDSVDGGGLQRGYGQVGIKGSMYQWRVYDNVESRFWDLNRMRHIMKEDFVLWASGTNVDPSEITPFDQGIETISGVDGASLGWRNRFQTKRGGPGNWQTVEWLTLDLEAGFFNDNDTTNGQNRTRGQTFSYRPENSITSNYISLDSKWQISDTMALLYDAIVDTNDWRMGESGLGLFIERTPRFNFFIGHRYIGLTKSNLMAFGANYRLNSKYTLGLSEEFDLERGQNADLEVILIRKMPRWNLALSAGVNDTEDINSVSLSVWPEGIPEWTLGSRKFTRMMKFLPLD